MRPAIAVILLAWTQTSWSEGLSELQLSCVYKNAVGLYDDYAMGLETLMIPLYIELSSTTLSVVVHDKKESLPVIHRSEYSIIAEKKNSEYPWNYAVERYMLWKKPAGDYSVVHVRENNPGGVGGNSGSCRVVEEAS